MILLVSAEQLRIGLTVTEIFRQLCTGRDLRPMVRLESEGYSVVLSYEEDGQTFVVREHLHGRSCETHLRAVCGRLISAMQSLYGRTRAMQRIENGDSKY